MSRHLDHRQEIARYGLLRGSLFTWPRGPFSSCRYHARRPAALVLEVKGDLCHDIRRILTELDRGGDYIERSLNGRLTWNPLSATWLDSYSLASPVASRWNHLFGKGKEPFGEPAYRHRDPPVPLLPAT